MISRDNKIHNSTSFLLLLFIIRSGCLAEIRWCVWMSKSHRSLYVSWVVRIPFVRMVKSKFLAQFPVDHLAHKFNFWLLSILHQFFSQDLEWRNVVYLRMHSTYFRRGALLQSWFFTHAFSVFIIFSYLFWVTSFRHINDTLLSSAKLIFKIFIFAGGCQASC